MGGLVIPGLPLNSEAVKKKTTDFSHMGWLLPFSLPAR